MTDNIASPFFIVGSGRSGTTLLRAILDAREDTRIPGETHFYTTYRVENLLRYHFRSPQNYAKAVRSYPHWRHVKRENLDWERFAEIASGLPPRRSSVLRAYLTACAETTGADHVGEKTPGHIRSLPRIWADFPGAKVIHVMRDPRAVAASYLSHDLYASVFGADVTRAALKWREAAVIHSVVAKGPNAATYTLLRYEDLVTNPDNYIAEMFDFLGLTRDPDILQKYRHARLTLPNAANHENIGRELTTATISKWRSVLTDDDVALVEAIAGSAMADFGYPHEAVHVVSRTHILARRVRFHWQFAGYGGKRLLRSFTRRPAR